MDLNEFKYTLVESLSTTKNPLIKNCEASLSSHSILITCYDDTKFFLQLEPSILQKTKSQESEVPNIEYITSSLHLLNEKNPLYYKILLTLLKMTQSNIITSTTFLNILESLVTNVAKSNDDYS